MNARVILAALAVACCAQLSTARGVSAVADFEGQTHPLLASKAYGLQSVIDVCPLALISIGVHVPATAYRAISFVYWYQRAGSELRDSLQKCGADEKCAREARRTYEEAVDSLKSSLESSLTELVNAVKDFLGCWH